MGSFKIWDNINYNLVILNKLYYYYNSESGEDKVLLKPIIILIITIIEALLKDYFGRIYRFTKEWVPGMTEEKLKEIREKKYEEFNTFISWSKKHNLFKEGDLFYSELDYLRKVRNYIHITWTKNEVFIFTEYEKKRQNDTVSILWII